VNDSGIHLHDDETLESLLLKQKDDAFPPYSIESGEKTYPDRYSDIKLALFDIHNIVEKSAMAQDLEKFIDDNKKCDKKDFIRNLHTALIYLNNHGRGHVEKVIQKVSEILHCFNGGDLTPYEIFILLCAIQIHDTGNIFGRKKHERIIGPILDEKCSPFIPDALERKLIEKIAMSHSGQLFCDSDTIGRLSINTRIKGKKVREQLLAALLRFGDELADDFSRSDRYAIEHDLIPNYSKIFHYYSQALHTVSIISNNESNEFQLELKYDFDSDIASMKFVRGDGEKYLLDEIYERTFKIERERRYCMRFLRPYLFINSIKVDINISHSQNVMINDKINYVLEEKGYPIFNYANIKEVSPEIHSGEEALQYLVEQGKINNE
jgi:hypothetical protein